MAVPKTQQGRGKKRIKAEIRRLERLEAPADGRPGTPCEAAITQGSGRSWGSPEVYSDAAKSQGGESEDFQSLKNKAEKR